MKQYDREEVDSDIFCDECAAEITEGRVLRCGNLYSHKDYFDICQACSQKLGIEFEA